MSAAPAFTVFEALAVARRLAEIGAAGPGVVSDPGARGGNAIGQNCPIPNSPAQARGGDKSSVQDVARMLKADPGARG